MFHNAMATANSNRPLRRLLSLQVFLPYHMTTLPNHPWHPVCPSFAYDLSRIWTPYGTANSCPEVQHLRSHYFYQ